jgi:uncharacterized protein
MADFSQEMLLGVLRDWSYWGSPHPPSIRRDALTQIGDWPPDLVWVIQGVRRCGKSTLLAQLISHFQLDAARCFFINFEDPRLSQGLNSTLLDQVVDIAARHAQGEAPRHFFFDEIQNVEGWERWLHRRVERPDGSRFVITGSNAALLGGRLASSLTGRHRTLELFPFSLREYQQARPGASFEDYLRDGGFPRPLSLPAPQPLLREYFVDIIERDVRRHVSARSTTALVHAASALFESTGSEVSLRKLAAAMDSTADTLRTYVDAFAAAYLVLPCPYFTYSERQRMVRAAKYYPIDIALRDAAVATPQPDLGKKLETAVFHHLRRNHRQIFYWRDVGEVDFVVMEGSAPRPVQVTWDGAQERHTRALSEFAQAHPRSLEPIIITRANVEAFFDRAPNP